MPPPQEPHFVGNHMLGPHVVGLRVVVRRVLPGELGPSGGPALTDLLGVCTAWGDGVCVLQPDGAPAVTIAIGDIVSGKPVPPRPSVRDRVPAREAQLRATALFDDLETEPLGDWLLRRSAGSPARRANSALAFGPSGVGDDDVGRVLDFYDRPVAALLPGTPEHERFVALGWTPESGDADTLFQVAGVAQVKRSLRAALPADAPEPALTVSPSARVVEARLPGAAGVAAYDDDWVGFRSIEVEPAHRRQGLALAIMASLVGWGAEQGATTAYLQVLGDNAPALALYEGLGFRTHHAYCYLVAPERGARAGR